jgi:tetratricopeptide (TPR) repeat protein
MKSSLAALALALTATSASATAQYSATSPQPQPQVPQQSTQAEAPSASAAGQPKPSAKAQAAILALQTAIDANDTANIPAKLAAAQAVASTPADHYWVARLQLNAAIKSNNLAAAQQAVDAVAAANALPTTTVAQLYIGIGNDLLKTKQYDQAVALYNKASALAPNNADYVMAIAQARSEQGQKDQAAAAVQRAIAISKTSGQKPSEELYKDATSLAYDSKLPSAVGLARDWVAAYPSDDSWRNSLAIYRNLNHSDPDVVLDVMRLSSLTNAMQTTGDYASYANKALDEGNYGEAKAAVDAGVAAGKLKASDRDVAQVLASTRGKIPTAAELAAAEKTAVIPAAFLKVGDRYYAAGDYSRAATLYREALAKGVDANLANLRIGEALARSGDKSGASAAFNAVTGPRAELAKFWLVYAQTHA